MIVNFISMYNLVWENEKKKNEKESSNVDYDIIYIIKYHSAFVWYILRVSNLCYFVGSFYLLCCCCLFESCCGPLFGGPGGPGGPPGPFGPPRFWSSWFSKRFVISRMNNIAVLLLITNEFRFDFTIAMLLAFQFSPCIVADCLGMWE